MKKFKAIMFNHWTLSILAIIAIAILVYFIGPLVSIADWTPFAVQDGLIITGQNPASSALVAEKLIAHA